MTKTMDKPTLAVPTVHLNGTSKTELVGGYREAVSALNEAYTKVNAAMPHGRDYYVQADAQAYNVARDQHVARLVKLQQIMDELEAVAIAVLDQ